MRRIRRQITYANVMSTIAVFAVLAGGSAWAASKIGTNGIKNGAVTTKKLKNGAVNTKKLKNGAVTTAKLADGAITEPKLGGGSVTEAKLGNGAVTEVKLGNGAVTGAKLADGAVSGEKLTPGAIGAAVTLVASESISVPGGEFREITLPCPPGMKVISGGFETGDETEGLWINHSKPADLGTSWSVGAQNEAAGPNELLVYGVCI